MGWIKKESESEKENKPKEMPPVSNEKKEPSTEAEVLKGVILEKEKQLEEEKHKLLRALADLDNFKKRMAQEREEIVKLSNETLIVAMLPVLDGLERAIQATKGNNGAEEILKGIALVKKQFEDTIAKFGVETIETMGKPFDPHFMEAIMQKESGGPEHIVLEEMQKGYTLFGKLIRPAMVIVSKKKG
jgi:molecular chaperone GrpE